MSAHFAAGFMIVLTCYVTMARMNMRRWLGYANVVDVLFTAGMIGLFHGTFAGMMAAAFAGFFMSTGLWVLRKLLGYEKLQRTGRLRYQWVLHPATFELPKLRNPFADTRTFNR